MEKESQRKILGAFIVGIALVSGAYIVANLNTPAYQQPAAAVQPQAAPRSAIEVVDSDNNGIEDWRDQFVSAEPVIINETVNQEYNAPDTLTGQTGVNFFKNFLENKIYSQNPNTNQQLIDSTIENLEIETSGFLYDTYDISILTEWDDTDIKNYANVMGDSIVSNNVPGLENELSILSDILRRGETERVEELKLIQQYYRTLTNEALATPVPALFVKEHLDLINTYHAIALDIEAMTKANDDPIVTMVRLNKYNDNSLGLRLALENMYAILLPYAGLFSSNDPAVTFTLFAPKQRI